MLEGCEEGFEARKLKPLMAGLFINTGHSISKLTLVLNWGELNDEARNVLLVDAGLVDRVFCAPEDLSTNGGSLEGAGQVSGM